MTVDVDRNTMPLAVYSPHMNSMIKRFGLFAFTVLAAAACGGSVSPYQGMDAPTLFQTAVAEYEEGAYENTIEAVDRLIINFGDWDRLPEARLLLANAHFAKTDFLTARSEYMRFLDRYSGSAEAPTAALGVCRSLTSLAPESQRDQTYTSDAITVCRNVVIDYAGTQQSVEAADLANEMRQKLAAKELETADFYFRRELFDSAIVYYDFVVRLYPETVYAPRGLAGLYHSNMAIGYDDLAETARDRLFATYPDSPEAELIRTIESGR